MTLLGEPVLEAGAEVMLSEEVLVTLVTEREEIVMNDGEK